MGRRIHIVGLILFLLRGVVLGGFESWDCGEKPTSVDRCYGFWMGEPNNYDQNNSYSSINFYANGLANYTFPGGNFSVSVNNEGISYRDYLDKGIWSELNVGNFGEYRSGSFWLEKGCLLGAYRDPETFSLDWENKLAKADPEAFNLIQGLEVKGPYGEIWKVSMIGGARNIDGTFICGLSQGFWSAGIDRHGQILPTGSGLLVDIRHQNYYAQLSKEFAPERTDWASNFTHGWYGNYLFNQPNQPAKNFFEDFGSPFLEDFTPQTIAQKYDPWLQNYTLYGGGVEQIQDARGRYETINRLDYPIERLGKVKNIDGEVEPAVVEAVTSRGGKVGEYTYIQSLKNPVGEVYLHDVRSGKNIIYTPVCGQAVGSLDFYIGKHKSGGWEEKAYEEPLKDLYGKREKSLGSARSEMANHIRNTAILSQGDELTVRNVNRRDFDSLGEVNRIARDKLIPTQRTIGDVIKMQSYIDNGNDWSNWDFSDERGNLRNGNELLTTAQDVAKEENISKGYRTVPWTTDFLKDSETKIISNFQVIESGGNLRKERLSLKESEGYGTKAIFALDRLEKTEVLHPYDGEVARENIGRVYDNLEEKVEYDHTYFPSERIFSLQKMAPAATALIGYAGLKLDSKSIKIGTGVLQLAQGRVPTGLSAAFSTDRAPVMRMFGPRLGKTVYELYQKTPAQKISYIDLAGGVLGVAAAGVSGYEFGRAINGLIEDGFRRGLPNFGIKGAGLLGTIGAGTYPWLLLLRPVAWGLDCGVERFTYDPIIIDATREFFYSHGED